MEWRETPFIFTNMNKHIPQANRDLTPRAVVVLRQMAMQDKRTAVGG
jgi:hypothetical protein